MTTGEILRAAAVVVRNGWWPGGRGDCQPTTYCASNAILEVTGQMVFSVAHGYLLRAIGAPDDVNPRPIFHWNDAPDQTVENVVAGLEYAALLWEQEQLAPSPMPADPVTA